MAKLSLRKPSPDSIRRFLRDQERRSFSYHAVGATAHVPPMGHVVDHTRIHLGNGESVFDAARAVLQRWEHFQLGWVEAWPAGVPITPGENVAVLARTLGVWWLNSCRIVYVVEEAGPIQRFGFAYGTLPGHVESGEERFLIEWNRRTNETYYDVLAFSRPNHVLAHVGYPLVRQLQKRFGRDSATATFRAVNGPSVTVPRIQQNTTMGNAPVGEMPAETSLPDR